MRATSFFVVIAFIATLALAMQVTSGVAFACRANGITYSSPDVYFHVGERTTTENYRGIHGGISYNAPPNPDPLHQNGYHINVTLGMIEANSQWVQTGWMMGLLVNQPTGGATYYDAPTVYYEVHDAVQNKRAVVATAYGLGRYEVSEGGQINGRWKYVTCHYDDAFGAWFQDSYGELPSQSGRADAWGEVTDTLQPTSGCLNLTNPNSTGSYHEAGSPDALILLTDIWRTWTSDEQLRTDPGPYKYYWLSQPTYEHFGVGGPQ